MIYREEKRNLFSVDKKYYLVHCISADFALGAGIAKEINKRYGTREKLRKQYPDYLNTKWRISKIVVEIMGFEKCDAADCILVDRVFNLVTKERYYYKPTYASIQRALGLLKIECQKRNIKYLAMPMIGRGLDKLQWDKVSEFIKDIFKHTDIEILVCKRE